MRNNKLNIQAPKVILVLECTCINLGLYRKKMNRLLINVVDGRKKYLIALYIVLSGTYDSKKFGIVRNILIPSSDGASLS